MFCTDNKLASDRLIEEYNRHGNIIIGVDFDDTINDTFNRGINTSLLVGMLRTLQQDHNCTLCVWTANQDEQLVRNKWKELNLNIDHYNTSPLANRFPGPKPYFNILLDDRAGLDSAYNTLKELLIHLMIKRNLKLKEELINGTKLSN